MQRKSFENLQCPIARSLERVGEWWSILILRDAFYGITRFDEFQKSLDIAANMLTRRLNGLVEEGLLERRQYCEKPPRYEYHLTQRGRDFRPVMLALLAYGNKHFAPEGESVVLVDIDSGARIDPVLVDRHTGKPISEGRYFVSPGPAASDSTLQRLDRTRQRRLEMAEAQRAGSDVTQNAAQNEAQSTTQSATHNKE